MKKINIELPFFSGFYESIYENCDTEYCAINEEIEYLKDYEGIEKEYDDFDYNHQQRREDIINAFIKSFKTYTPDCVEDVVFEALISPKYYNYSTDKIYADITLTDEWKKDFKAFIKKNKESLEERIYKDWSSRDGFLSFVSNRLDYFCTHLFDETDKEQDMYIGIMLEYIMESEWNEKKYRHEEDLYWTIAMDVLENIYDGSYVTLKNAE